MKTPPVLTNDEPDFIDASPQVIPGRLPKTILPKRLNTVALRKGDKIYIVNLADILYLEAKGFYTKIVFLHQGKKQDTLICKLLNRVEKEYTNDNFFRVHKSYILNIANLSTIVRHGSLNVEMKTGDLIPVAKRRVQQFLTYIRSKPGS